MSTTTAPPVLPPAAEAATWTARDAEKLYNVKGWGLGYFRVNGEGHVVVHPDGREDGPEIDLFHIAMDMSEQGVGLPLLLRFSDILHSRISELASRFREAITEFGCCRARTSHRCAGPSRAARRASSPST